mgnify:CR=1 FL=1
MSLYFWLAQYFVLFQTVWEYPRYIDQTMEEEEEVSVSPFQLSNILILV